MQMAINSSIIMTPKMLLSQGLKTSALNINGV